MESRQEKNGTKVRRDEMRQREADGIGNGRDYSESAYNAMYGI